MKSPAVSLWLPLILFFASWPFAAYWLHVAGQAGSPQPRNWEQLSLRGDLAGLLALLLLVASSIVFGIQGANGRRPPTSTIVSNSIVVLLVEILIVVLALFVFASLVACLSRF